MDRHGRHGFAEVGLRSHADGCDPARPACYLEGWYIAEEFRRGGIIRRLLSAAENWTRSHGCVEMASDTWIRQPTFAELPRSVGLRSRRSVRALSQGAIRSVPT